MKTIKKVEVVPLDVNYGKIINSFSTTDDKTKNAPSINAVENYVQNEIDTAESELESYALPKNNIQVLTGSIEAAANTTTTDTKDYPTGFTKDNCVVISIGSSSGTLTNTMCFPKFVQGSTTDVRVRLLNDNIEFSFMNASSNTINTDYIIVLMKIS